MSLHPLAKSTLKFMAPIGLAVGGIYGAATLNGVQDRLRPKSIADGALEPTLTTAGIMAAVGVPTALGALGLKKFRPQKYQQVKQWLSSPGVQKGRAIFLNRVAPALTAFAGGLSLYHGWKGITDLKRAKTEEDIQDANHTLGHSLFDAALVGLTGAEGTHLLPKAALRPHGASAETVTGVRGMADAVRQGRYKDALVPRLLRRERFDQHFHPHLGIREVGVLHEPSHLAVFGGIKHNHDHGGHNHDHAPSQKAPPSPPQRGTQTPPASTPPTKQEEHHDHDHDHEH